MADESRQLGRYELVKRIATGGMGVIYLAKSRGAAGFEKTVIIKKILDHLAEEEEFVTKFCDEGRIVVNLTHGNIVPVFDMGEEDGEYFIAMEYVPGRDLRAVLKRLDEQNERLPIQLAVHIITEVCKGLDYAHRKTDEAGRPLNIVHRDVSPSNILISREGEVKIIDFGIARAASRAAKTVSGRIQGKVCYMSPEQAQAHDLDHRSDIFSAGVVLYEMLTGTRPFQGESDLQSLDLVRQCDFQEPRELNPDIAPELAAIVKKALARDPDERYASIDQMHVELLEWLYSGGRAVTSQKLAEFVSEVFPEGFERQELREARDTSSQEVSEERPMNLDEALNAKLDRLKDEPAPNIDPLRTTAADGGGKLAKARTSTLDDTPASPSPAQSADSSPKRTPADAGGESHPEGAGDDSGAGEAADVEPRDDAPPSESPSQAELKDAAPDANEPAGFKRWLAIAMGLGLLLGAVGLYIISLDEPGVVDIRTEPSGATIEVDGVRVAGAETPHALELDEGRYTIGLTKEGYEPEKFEVEVEGGEESLLDGDTIALEAVQDDDTVRRTWATVSPEEATIRINGGETTATGKARIDVSPGEQILVEADHPDCQKRTEFITYTEANQGIKLQLDCDEPDEDEAGEEERKLEPDMAPRPVAEQRPSQNDAPQTTSIRFATDPPGGDILVDGKQLEDGEAIDLEIGRTVALKAARDGYETVDKELRVGHNLGDRYTIELEELATGCVTVRPPAGQQAKLSVNGESRGWVTGERLELPVGVHEITLTYADGTTNRYRPRVSKEGECPIVGFDDDDGDEASAGKN